MDWIANGMAVACIVLGTRASRVERHAAEMLTAEVAERSGTRLTVLTEDTIAEANPTWNWIVLGTPASHGWIRRAAVHLPTEDDTQSGQMTGQAVAVKTSSYEGRPAAFAVGSGERGALYAAAELLDRLIYRDGSASLPEVDYHHVPAFALRGSGHIHYGPLEKYEEGSPHWARLARAFHFIARRRGNVVLMDPGWPAGYADLVEYRHFPELYDPTRSGALEPLRARGRQAIDMAASYGIETYLTTAELFHPAELPHLFPEALAVDPGSLREHFEGHLHEWRGQQKPHLCASHPVTWRWYQAKMREIMEHFPAAAGIELWVSWSDTDVWYCACQRCRQRTPAEHLQELVEKTLEALDLAAPGGGKRLLLRTYLGGWRQILEVPFFAPLKGKLGSRVLVLNKAQYGDMYYGNAPHPLTGLHVPENDEGVEFCLGGEYRGGLQWGMLAPITQLLADRLSQYHGLGVSAAFERHLLWRNRFNEADFDVFYALAWDLDASPEQIWQDWAARRYGAASGPRVVEILREGTRVMEKAFYARGVSFTSHHLFAESLERLRHLTFDRSGVSVAGGMAKVAPTPENIELILQEKDEAVAVSQRLLARLAALEGCISAEDHRALTQVFKLQHEIAQIYRALARVFWPYLRWAATLSEVEREFQRQDMLPALADLRAASARLRQQAPQYWNPELFAALGSEPVTVESINFDRDFPYTYLDRIADDVAQDITVEKASLWGYYPRPADM